MRDGKLEMCPTPMEHPTRHRDVRESGIRRPPASAGVGEWRYESFTTSFVINGACLHSARLPQERASNCAVKLDIISGKSEDATVVDSESREKER